MASADGLCLYMDESGGSDPGTPHATVGGMLIWGNQFRPFEDAWQRMLCAHGIHRDGIHMKELGKNGKLGALSVGDRHDLFEDACYLIKKHRVVTLVASLRNEEYEANVPELAREQFSVYGMLFNLAVFINHELAKVNNYSDAIPIIMDTGNPHRGHVIEAHKFMLTEWQRTIGDLHLGTLTFDDDTRVHILQAADIIAWAARRRACGTKFLPGLEPVEQLLTCEQERHAEVSWKPELLRDLGSKLAQLIAEGRRIQRTDQ